MQNISRENIRQYLAYKLFLFVHIPPIFSVLLTYSLKINSLLFCPPPVASRNNYRALGIATQATLKSAPRR